MASNLNAMDVDVCQPPPAPAQPTALAYPVPTELPKNDHIILDIDGHKYRTRQSTLSISRYFQKLFSGQWPVDMLPDGSLPIDADHDIWPTLFAYIKWPSVFPLLWTREKGFDYVGYNRLLAEADYFGLDYLRDWIKQKKFLEAVKTGYKVEIHPGQLNQYTKSKRNFKWVGAGPPSFPTKGDPNQPDINVFLDSIQPSWEDDTRGEDVELISCFEAKIPSQGPFQCYAKNPFHHHQRECEELGEVDCEPPTDNLHDEKIWKYETLETSIVTVVKHIDYRPERCENRYFDAEDVEHEEEGQGQEAEATDM